MTASFAERLGEATTRSGTLCVGIDPHAGILDAWGLPDTAAGARDLGLRVVEATRGRAGVVKPQIAFFERHGPDGYAALADVLAAARAASLFVIADVKRGDVGSTVAAYGEAWLTPGAPLEADAMTALAYQGLGSLDAVFDRAVAQGKGVIVVAAASNPEAAAVQGAVRADGRTVAAALIDEARALGGTAGVVIGATVRLSDYAIDPAALTGVPILAPGFGAQGARIADLRSIFGTAAPNVLVSLSRELLAAGPTGIGEAIERTAGEVAACLS
jgi:orotidine-5'-phosphate decarboxylase